MIRTLLCLLAAGIAVSGPTNPPLLLQQPALSKVAPDVDVEFEPEAWRQGRDPQLERAVQYVLDELKKHPAPVFKRPAYPNYHK
jgi:hypothetical protein